MTIKESKKDLILILNDSGRTAFIGKLLSEDSGAVHIETDYGHAVINNLLLFNNSAACKFSFSHRGGVF